MTDEEIIQKSFNDNSCKYEDWKDCCVAMMRDAMRMKEEQMSNKEKIKKIKEYVLQLEEDAPNYDDSMCYLSKVECFIDDILNND